MMIDFGLDTFGDITVGDDDETPVPASQVLRDIVDQATLADRLGIDSFNVGEHHRYDYAITAPEVVLAAIAGRTERIRLGSAVTVLSSDDPVRVYERFATLDGVSGGRAEITLGRGSFTESFPLFGYDLADYEVLFSEKLELFHALLDEQPVTWSGTKRPPLNQADVFPKTASGRLPVWIGVGGSPESVLRAAKFRLPLMLAIIGGSPLRFRPFVELYRRSLAELGAEPLPIGIHSPGFVAETDELARDRLFPYFKANRDLIGSQRGWPPLNAHEFQSEIDHGALFVGSPETVATKIATSIRGLGVQRFDLKYSHGPIPHSMLMETIELYATAVLPRVRELLNEDSDTA